MQANDDSYHNELDLLKDSDVKTAIKFVYDLSQQHQWSIPSIIPMDSIKGACIQWTLPNVIAYVIVDYNHKDDITTTSIEVDHVNDSYKEFDFPKDNHDMISYLLSKWTSSCI
jgi:hypothetical protein